VTHAPDPYFPRGPLLAAAGLVFGTLITVAVIRVTGTGAVRHPDAKLVTTRELRFEDDKSGAVNVYDPAQDRQIAKVEPGVGGFVRATLRGLGRERKRRGVAPEATFRLTLWSDGRFTLEDRYTDRRIDLEAFGATNAGAFARFLQPTTLNTDPDPSAARRDDATALQLSRNSR
jgi:putative photosynthetic complex assembly protein